MCSPQAERPALWLDDAIWGLHIEWLERNRGGYGYCLELRGLLEPVR
jgi:hypothetical protein